VNDIMANRSAALNEVSGVGSTGLDFLRNLPGVTSLAGAADAARLVDAGIFDRQTMSAGNFRAPINIGSAIYDSNLNTLTPGMADFNVGTSAAFNRSSGVGSAVTNPVTLGLENPQGYFSSAGNIGTNLFEASGNRLNNARAGAGEAWSTFGTNFRDFLDDNQNRVGGFFNNIFGGGSAPRTSPFPMANPRR
jgi:hypothetical protein